MRILLSTPYDLAVPGGVNRHALDLLDALTRRGHEARLIGPASRPVLGEDARVTILGRVWVGSFNGARSRITLDLGLAGSVRRLVRAFAPQVVHAQEPVVPTLNTFALLFAGEARRVGTFHTYSESSRGYLWTWPWRRWSDALLDVRVAVSPAARDFAALYHPGHYTIVPNGVRLPAEDEVRAPRPCGSPVRLLFVGRADEPRKGFPVLRAAMARLSAAQPGRFALSVVGPHPPGECGADAGRIDWLGEADDRGLSQAYANADIAVAASLGGESFGLVALEALVHGVPLVATRIRGYADWLGPQEAAELVPPGDAGALADAIARLADDPARHALLAAHGRRVAETYAWDRIVDRLLELYEGAAHAGLT